MTVPERLVRCRLVSASKIDLSRVTGQGKVIPSQKARRTFWLSLDLIGDASGKNVLEGKTYTRGVFDSDYIARPKIYIVA